jgi:NAD-dependent DNA ligase
LNIKELNEIHKSLRRYRYFYYVCEDIIEIDKNTISDYDYDMLEKQYNKYCNELEIPLENRVSNYVGFDIAIPMNLYYKDLLQQY